MKHPFLWQNNSKQTLFGLKPLFLFLLVAVFILFGKNALAENSSSVSENLYSISENSQLLLTEIWRNYVPEKIGEHFLSSIPLALLLGAVFAGFWLGLTFEPGNSTKKVRQSGKSLFENRKKREEYSENSIVDENKKDSLTLESAKDKDTLLSKPSTVLSPENKVVKSDSSFVKRCLFKLHHCSLFSGLTLGDTRYILKRRALKGTVQALSFESASLLYHLPFVNKKVPSGVYVFKTDEENTAKLLANMVLDIILNTSGALCLCSEVLTPQDAVYALLNMSYNSTLEKINQSFRLNISKVKLLKKRILLPDCALLTAEVLASSVKAFKAKGGNLECIIADKALLWNNPDFFEKMEYYCALENFAVFIVLPKGINVPNSIQSYTKEDFAKDKVFEGRCPLA